MDIVTIVLHFKRPEFASFTVRTFHLHMKVCKLILCFFSTLKNHKTAQRSAQELPHIEKYSINSCSVNGGHEMIITGSNFLPESKIIFLEKRQGK